MSIASRNQSARRAASRQCPQCHRKSALKIDAYPEWGQVVSYCRWEDCGYEHVTDTHHE